MRLSPAFVYLAIVSIGSAVVVDSAPVTFERRLLGGAVSGSSNGVVLTTSGNSADLASVRAEPHAHGKDDTLDVDVNLCKVNAALGGLVGQDCQRAIARQRADAQSRKSDAKDDQTFTDISAHLGGDPLSGSRTPAALVTLGNDEGSKGLQGHRQRHDDKGDHPSSVAIAAHGITGAGDGARQQQGKNNDHHKSSSHGKKAPKSSSQGAASSHAKKNSNKGGAKKSKSTSKSSSDAKDKSNNDGTLLDVKADPSSTSLLGSNAMGLGALTKTKSDAGTESNHRANPLSGSANGGSVDCSSSGGLLGLSSLNINSCNGGNGGNNVVGGSSKDDHRQSLLGLLHRRLALPFVEVEKEGDDEPGYTTEETQDRYTPSTRAVRRELMPSEDVQSKPSDVSGATDSASTQTRPADAKDRIFFKRQEEQDYEKNVHLEAKPDEYRKRIIVDGEWKKTSNERRSLQPFAAGETSSPTAASDEKDPDVREHSKRQDEGEEYDYTPLSEILKLVKRQYEDEEDDLYDEQADDAAREEVSKADEASRPAMQRRDLQADDDSFSLEQLLSNVRPQVEFVKREPIYTVKRFRFARKQQNGVEGVDDDDDTPKSAEEKAAAEAKQVQGSTAKDRQDTSDEPVNESEGKANSAPANAQNAQNDDVKKDETEVKRVDRDARTASH